MKTVSFFAYIWFTIEQWRVEAQKCFPHAIIPRINSMEMLSLKCFQKNDSCFHFIRTTQLITYATQWTNFSHSIYTHPRINVAIRLHGNKTAQNNNISIGMTNEEPRTNIRSKITLNTVNTVNKWFRWTVFKVRSSVRESLWGFFRSLNMERISVRVGIRVRWCIAAFIRGEASNVLFGPRLNVWMIHCVRATHTLK